MIDNKSTFFKVPGAVEKRVNPKIGIAFIILIILQFYLLPLMPLVVGTDINKYAAYTYFYAMSSYTMIVLGIMIFQANGIVLFQDHFTLWIIVLSCFLRTNLGGDHKLIYSNYFSFLGVILSIYILANRKNIKFPNLKLIFIGLLWSVGTVIIIALLYTLSNSVYSKSLPLNLFTIVINTFVFQLSFVTVIEEACFRGLIVGFMIMNGYKENTALFIQAILFWGIHYMDIIANPALFFIIVPLFTLSATLIIKKYKMLYLSIIMHTLFNVCTSILVTVLHRYLS